MILIFWQREGVDRPCATLGVVNGCFYIHSLFLWSWEVKPPRCIGREREGAHLYLKMNDITS